MKVLKFIPLVLFALLSISCNNSQRNSDKKNFINSNDDQKLALISKETKESSTSLKELVVGYLDEKGEFKFTSEEVKKTVEQTYHAIALKMGFDVDFNDFEYVPKEDNNGYYMLTSLSEDKKSGESVNLGKGLILNEMNRSFVFDQELSDVACTGCRRGCNPRREPNGDGYCTDCKITNSNCSKTETGGH